MFVLVTNSGEQGVSWWPISARRYDITILWQTR